MATISVFGGKVVLMSGHAKQKRIGSRLGGPGKAIKRAREWSARGYAIPTGNAVEKAQRALMSAAHSAAGVDAPKPYEQFMDEIVPKIPTGYELYVGAGEFERRRKARLAATARKLGLPA